MIFHIFSYYTTLLYQKKNLKTNNVIGSIFLGKSFGNVLFGVSVNARILLLYEVFNEMSIMEFLIKYNFYGVFNEMSIME